MRIFFVLSSLLSFFITEIASHALLYNPYYRYFRYGATSAPSYHQTPIYANGIQSYTPLFSRPNILPTFNVLAETPYSIENHLSVVPMFVIPQSNIHMISKGEIVDISKQKPVMTIKTQNKNVVQCTPAVRVVLEQPLVVYNLKSDVLFPSAFSVVHENVRIPIEVGAVIVPVAPHSFVSTTSPLSVNVVYAVPTRPINVDLVSFESDFLLNRPVNVGTQYLQPAVPPSKDEADTVVVETDPINSNKNTITVLNFPDRIATPDTLVYQPTLGTDDELENRNPPLPVIPAGIVQSSQPEPHQQLFQNSKESEILNELREQSKNRLRT